MKAEHHSSSNRKDTTLSLKVDSSPFKPPRPLLATAVIGAALIGYLVHKTPDARLRLESLANMAYTMGDLTDQDAAVVTKLLATPEQCPVCKENVDMSSDTNYISPSARALRNAGDHTPIAEEQRYVH